VRADGEAGKDRTEGRPKPYFSASVLMSRALDIVATILTSELIPKLSSRT
jgi:hypothetical protein